MKKAYSFIILTIIIFSIITIKSFAYDIECNMILTSMPYPEPVTTGVVKLKINLTNSGENNFSATEVNTTIYTPDNQILEPQYSFEYNLKNLSINESFTYEIPFGYGNSNYTAIYETPIPGTWKIIVTLLNLPKDNITYTHIDYNGYEVVRRDGECRKYFFVKDLGQYQDEQIRKDEISASNGYQTRAENLNIALLILSIILSLDLVYRFAKAHRKFIIGAAGIIISIYFFFVKTSLINIAFIDDAFRLIFSFILFISSIFILLKNKINKNIYIIVLASVWMIIGLFSIEGLVSFVKGDYFSGTLELISSLVVMLSVYLEWTEKENNP